jgi:hypothetical protein
MTTDEETIAVAAFTASLNNQVRLAGETGMVQIQEPFDLRSALRMAFTAVEEHKIETAIKDAKKAEGVVIFDP